MSIGGDLKHKIIMRVTPTGGSAITALRAKFAKAGIEPKERKFTFTIDSRERDRYGAGSPASDLGARIRPIEQPSKRKGGSRQGRGNWRASGHKFEPKFPFVCKYCGKPGLAKMETREFCDNGGLCYRRFGSVREKAGKA